MPLNAFIKRFCITAATGCVLLCRGAAPAQGPLTPPGTPAPTMKSLQQLSDAIGALDAGIAQIEPRTPVDSLPGNASALHVISQSGAYILTGDITGQSGKAGILINASHVTLDLNGFALLGTTGTLDGITAAAGLVNLTVTNGTVSGWKGDGVDLSGAQNCRVERVRAENNAGAGIHGGDSGAIEHCIAMNNQTGLRAGATALITHCTAAGNSQHGISALYGATIAWCSVSGSGADGINTDVGANITHCTVRQSGQAGIRLLSQLSGRQPAAHVTNCTVAWSGTSGGADTGGIISSGNAFILDNTIADGKQTNNTFGILVNGAGTRVDGNLIAQCSKGIVLKAGGNMVVRNTFSGIAPANLIDSTGTNFIGPTVNDPNSALAGNPLANVLF
ncbi:MAG: hypothetical protein Kow0059_16800 [Candidatus Sumerlaeia bacterium]